MIKSKRTFLEPQKHSDSYIKTTVTDSGFVDIKLADCFRSIQWEFGGPGNKRAIAKITKIKEVIDEIYNHLVPK